MILSKQNWSGTGDGLEFTVTLLLFAFAAPRIPLATLGVVQYITPTLQLIIGVFIYEEAFPEKQMIGFVLVWCGLLIYATEGIVMRVKQRKACRVTTIDRQVPPE